MLKSQRGRIRIMVSVAELTCSPFTCTLLSPMHSEKLNSTELLSSVQFPAVHWTGDDLRRFGDEIGGRRRVYTIGTHSRKSFNRCNVCRWTKTGDELRRLAAGSWLSRTCDGRRGPSPVQCNDPVQFSWVEFSPVFRCALGFMYMYVCHSALEPAVDEYGQLQQRLQIEQGCRSEAEKYACKVIDFLTPYYHYSWYRSSSLKS